VEISPGHSHWWWHLERTGQRLAKEGDLTGARRKLSKTSAFTREELEVMWKRTRITVAQEQVLSSLRAPSHVNQGQVLSQPSIEVSQMRSMLIIRIL
jgi:hypothetical protein